MGMGGTGRAPGKRFLFAIPAPESTREAFTVVLNWPAALKSGVQSNAPTSYSVLRHRQAADSYFRVVGETKSIYAV
jgi:hypothetical protein